MRIAVLGTGSVGQTLSETLSRLGHQVMLGTRNVENTMTRNTKDMYGGAPFSEWYATHKDIKLGLFSEATVFSELIINATSGSGSISALKMAGAAALTGKTLIDAANPIDHSKGNPLVLIPSMVNTTSLGEEIQRSFPRVNVVKALNTMWAGLMVNPGMINNGDHNAFICGNEVSAKSTVVQLLTEFGWKKEKIIDLGDITASRGMEMVLPFWLRIMMTRGNGAFNYHIVS